MKGTHASASFIGRVGKDAKIIGGGSNSGYQSCVFSIATVSGKGQYERTNWWDVKLIGKEARVEFASQIARQGARVFVTGELTQREWTDQSGNKKLVTELLARDIVPLDPRDDNRQERSREPQRQQQQRPQQPAFDSDLDDDVPF